MSNTPARVPFSRGASTSFTEVDRNFQRLERNLAGVFTATILVAALSPYTVEATDWLVLCDCTAGAITVTFPLAARVDGLPVMVVKTDASANAVTLSGTFSGAVNPTLTAQYAMRTINAGNGVYHFTPKPADIPSGTFPGSYTVVGTITVGANVILSAGELAFGGLTAADVTLIRTTTTLNVELGDHSAWADFKAAAITGTGDLTVAGNTTVTNKVSFDASVTAGNTRMLVYCVDTGAVSRVKTTAAGVAPGAGDRTLYV